MDELLEEVTSKVHQLKPEQQSRSPGMPLVSLLGVDLAHNAPQTSF